MMWMHVCILLLFLTCSIALHDHVSEDQIRDQFSQAALDILSSREDHDDYFPAHHGSLDFLSADEHEDTDPVQENSTTSARRWKRSPVTSMPTYPATSVPPVPVITVPESEFVHGYVSQTGVGNREEVSLSHVSEVPVRIQVQEPPISWRFTRFDSSSYFLSSHRSLVTVWRTSVTPLTGLSFDPSSIVCQIDTRVEGEVVSSELHAVAVHQSLVLRIAVIIRNKYNVFQLRTYEVSDKVNNCFPISVFDLKSVPRRLAFVSSHYESGIVVLVDKPVVMPAASKDKTMTHDDLQVDFKQSGRFSESRLIEVSVSNAIDMEAFNVAGHSYIVTAHREGVQIGRLNEFLTHSMPFDLHPISGVTDVSSFSMGFEHFLVVATSGPVQYIFEWKDGSFRLKQTLDISKVFEVVIIDAPSCRDDVLLSFLRFDHLNPVLVFTWSGAQRQFVPAVDNIRKYIPIQYQLLPRSATSFPHNQTGHLLVMDTAARPHVLAFHTHLVPVSDPVYVDTMRANQMMANMRQRIVTQEQFVHRLQQQLLSAVSPSGFNVLPSHPGHRYSLRDITSIGAAILSKVRNLKSLVIQGSPLRMQDLRIRLTDLRTDVSRMTQLLADIERNFKHIAFKNLPTVMTGSNTIAASDAFLLNSNTSIIDVISDHPVHPVVSSVFLPKHPMPVSGRKFFDSLRVSGHVSAVINEIDLINAVTIDRVNRVTAKTALPVVDVRGNLVISRISGVNLLTDLIRIDTAGAAFDIMTPVMFTSPLFVDGLQSPLIDQVDVTALRVNSLQTHGDQESPSVLVLKGKTLFGKDARIGSLNHLRLQDLDRDVVRIDRSSSLIPGTRVFASPQLVVKRGIAVNGSLDGIRVPADLLLTNVPQTITSSTRLAGHQEFSEVTVDMTIDGVALRDVVTLTKDDSSPSVILKKGVDVFGSVSAGRVDTIDLNHLNTMSVKASEGKLIDPHFDGPVFVGQDISVTGTTNRIKLAKIAEDVLLKNSIRSPVKVTGTKVFAAGMQTVAPLVTGSVNSYDLSVFASTRSPQSIQSKLILTCPSFGRLVMSKPIVNHNINIVELFTNHISLSAPGNIVTGKHFLSELRIMGNMTMTADKMIMDVPAHDLVSKSQSSPRVITGKKTFTDLRMESELRVGNDVTTGLIDSKNLTSLNFMRLTLNTQQILKHMPVVILDSSVDSLIAGKVNDQDAASFFPSIMSRTRDQIVSGRIEFKSAVESSGNIDSVRGINQGIKLKRIAASAVKLNGVTSIFEPMSFEHDLSVDHGANVYGGLLNQVNMNLFMGDLLYKKAKTGQVVDGVNEFMSGFSASRDIDAGKVNSRYLPTESLLRVSDQLIHGTVIFRQSLSGIRNLRTNDSVNGINLMKFDRSIMQTNRPSILSGDITLTRNAHVVSDIRVAGRVSGVKLSHLARSTLFKFEDQLVTGAKTTTGGIDVTANLEIGSLNGTPFQAAVRDTVSRYSRSITRIPSFKEFARPCKTLSNLVTSSKITAVDGWVNGVNLDHLMTTAVWMNQPVHEIIGVKTFTSDAVVARSGVRISGRVNRVNILNDVLFRVPHPSGKMQQVDGKKTMYGVISKSDVQVHGRVNNMHLAATASDSLFLNGDQRILGSKKLSGKLVLSSDALIDSLNSMSNMSMDLAVLRSDCAFHGEVTIINPVSVRDQTFVSGLVNHVNITDLAAFSVNKDSEQVIHGPLTFDHVVFLNNVTTRGPITGVHLNHFAHNVTSLQHQLSDNSRIMNSAMNSQHVTGYRVFDMLQESGFGIDHFVRVQELPRVYGKHFEIQGSGMLSIAELDRSGVNTTVHALRYRKEQNKFEVRQVHQNVPYVKRQYFKLDDSEFTITRVSTANDNAVTEIRRSGRVVVQLDPFIDDFDVLVKNNTAIIASFVGVKGQIKVQVLKYFEERLKFTTISVLSVGPSATSMKLFVMDHELYLAVARSFRGQCTVSDYGSLLFVFKEGSNFQLIQRIPVSGSTIVKYYEDHDLHYLAFTDADTDGSFDHDSQSIKIFRKKDTSGCQFSLFQTIPVHRVNDMTIFSHGPSGRQAVYLAMVTDSSLLVSKQSGSSGFANEWNMRITGGLAVKPILIADSGKLFLIVGQGHKCSGSLVFEAVTSGASLLPVAFHES